MDLLEPGEGHNKERDMFKKLFGDKNNVDGCNYGSCGSCGESGPKQQEWQDFDDGRKHYLEPYHRNLDWKFFVTLAPGLHIVTHALDKNKKPLFMTTISEMGKARYAQWNDEIKDTQVEDNLCSVFFIKEKFDEFVVALMKGKVRTRRQSN